MEKHNADKYLQSQRSSLVTIHNSVGGKSPTNGLPEGLRSNLTPIAEQDFTFDDHQMKQPSSSSTANGYGDDPTMTLVPHHYAPATVDPTKSPDDESVVSDTQVYLFMVSVENINITCLSCRHPVY